LKIIFLDIDGVLNSKEYYKKVNMKIDNWDRFDPETVKLINALVQEFNARIVITSSWRFGAKDLLFKELKKSQLLKHLYKNWETPMIYLGTRGEEIKQWMAKHPEVNGYVILDDRDDILPEQLAHFIKTDIETGFKQVHYEKARSILLGNIPQ
jgi:HAD domain in Swiss Army Knife RNA repair proteins